MELVIEQDKALRIMSQMLREEGKMLPGPANDLAAAICRRLVSSMGTPKAPQLTAHRIIRQFPPHGSSFETDLAKAVPAVDRQMAREIWGIVYSHGRDLPATVADPRNY